MKTRRSRHGAGLVAVCAIGLIAPRPSPAKPIDAHTTVFVANRDSSDITMIDVRTDEIRGRIPLGDLVNPHMAMVTPDGKRLLVAGTKRNTAFIVDLASQQITARIPVGIEPEHFDITGDGKVALMGNLGEGTVSVLDLERGTEVKRLSGFAEPHGFAFLPDGRKAYVSSVGAHEVAAVDTAGLEIARRLAVGSSHLLASANPDRYLTEIKGVVNPTVTVDGRFVFAADGDSGELAVIDTRTDEIVKTIRVGEEPWRAYPSPDGSKMVVPNNGDETISVIDVAKQKVMATLHAGPKMTGVNFDAMGRKAYVFSSGDYGTVLIYDLGALREMGRKSLGPHLSLETATTTPDGAKVYLASSTDNSVYVIHTADDHVTRIGDVGQSPWATTMLGAYQYCH